MSARCPHCQTELPEAATFCAACGRRMAGWSGVPAKPVSAPLPGGEEPTRQMEPTPSLLRVAALPRPTSDLRETDSAILRSVQTRRFPAWAWLVAGTLAAAGVAYRLASRPSTNPDAVAVAPPALTPPVAAVPPPVPVAPAAAIPPPPVPAVVAAAPTAKSSVHKAVEPGGGLPHKVIATDSKSIAPVAPTAAAPAPPVAAMAPPVAAPEALPTTESTPLTPPTEEEQRHQAAAQFDAGSVRMIVKQHLAQVHACYQRAFKDGSLGGRVELAFTLTASGRAQAVRVESNSTSSELLSRCLESALLEWQFPRPISGDVELIYPFVFSPGS